MLRALLLAACVMGAAAFTSMPPIAQMRLARGVRAGPRMEASAAGEEREPAPDAAAAAVFLNEREMLSEQGFPRRYKAKLVKAAQTFLAACGSTTGRPDRALLADAFEFHGGNGNETLTTADFFAGKTAGRLSGEFYGFSIDPYEPTRVWFNARAPRSASARPAQSCSLTFNADGKVLVFTAHTIDTEHSPLPPLRSEPAEKMADSAFAGLEAALLPKPARTASTPPPPSPPRHAKPAMNVAAKPGATGAAEEEQRALARQLELSARQRAEIARLSEQCASLQAKVARLEPIEREMPAPLTSNGAARLKEACDRYEAKIAMYEEKLAQAAALMDEAAARHQQVLDERWGFD